MTDIDTRRGYPDWPIDDIERAMLEQSPGELSGESPEPLPESKPPTRITRTSDRIQVGQIRVGQTPILIVPYHKNRLRVTIYMDDRGVEGTGDIWVSGTPGVSENDGFLLPSYNHNGPLTLETRGPIWAVSNVPNTVLGFLSETRMDWQTD